MSHEIEHETRSFFSRIPWKKSLVLFVIGLGLLVLYVAFTDLSQVVQILSNADPRLLVLAVLSIILGSVFYTIAWQKLLKLTKLPTSFLNAWYYVYIGQFFNLIVPIAGSAGIAARAYLIREERITNNEDEPDIWGRALTSQTAIKICVTIWCVVAGVLSLVYLIWKFPLTRLTTIAIVFFLVISIISISILIFISVHPNAPTRLAHAILNTIMRIFPFTQPRIDAFRPRAVENAKSFSIGMNFLVKQKIVLLYTLFFSFLYYASFIIAAWLSFMALGLRQPVLVVCAVATVALIIELLGVGLPGGLGFKEIITAELFTVVFAGSLTNLSSITPKAAAISASIMINVLMFWVPLALSSIFIFKAIPLLRKAVHTMSDIDESYSTAIPSDGSSKILQKLK